MMGLHVQVLSVVFLFLWGLVGAGILDPFNWARSDRIEVNLPWLPYENETRCYDELGCLNITRSWYHLINRPFNVFPLPRAVINTRFILYTRLNPSEGQFIRANNQTIERSNLDIKKGIKFIIHGFIDTPLSNWVGDMRDELLKAYDVNVIVVDWAGGSLPLYTQATANTRLVGLEIAYLINYFVGMPPHVRLDPTDADLVDVIHTDGKGIFFLGYGMSQPCGHLDFYPNDGKEQPGCDITQTPLVPLTLIREGLEEASRVLVACNHVRAIKLFTDSINSKCPYIAHQCSNYNQFKEGKCFTCKQGTNCAIMGYHADATPGLIENNDIPQERLQETTGLKYYLTTGRQYPYCNRIYRVSIELAQPVYAESWVQGHLKAAMYSPNGVIHIDLTPSGDAKLEHGSTYTTVVSHPVDMAGNVRKVELNWEYDMNVLEPRTLCLFWCNDHLYVKNVLVEEMELPGRGKRDAQFSKRLCSKGKKDHTDIANRGKGIFIDPCISSDKYAKS
ncbi:hypothetical protein NQ317_012128 [Molorchus minor]|uniref:Lipase domain-containing protein n=1 Tax=Molorchus minor TaxID=1323400 RepID=A0ABQ9K364_9CUCU|nr:hypothetical protein NQ317_012128 [Molorchus minor]